MPVPVSVAVMADRTRTILEKALDALVRQDAVMARDVLVADDEIDELYAELIEELKGVIRADLEHLDAIVLLFSVARYLERLADHATNIAEDVLYMVEGEIQPAPARPPVAPGTGRGAAAALRDYSASGDADPADAASRKATGDPALPCRSWRPRMARRPRASAPGPRSRAT